MQFFLIICFIIFLVTGCNFKANSNQGSEKNPVGTSQNPTKSDPTINNTPGELKTLMIE